MSVQSSQPHIPAVSNLDLLKSELQKLDQLQGRKEVTDTEVQAIVGRVNDLGKDVIKEYTDKRSLGQITGILTEMKEKIREANEILKKSSTKAVDGKLKILFTSKVTSPEASAKKEGTNKVDDTGQLPGAVKKGPINEKQFVQGLTNSLSTLERTINDSLIESRAVDHFKKKTSFPEDLAILCEKFVRTLFKKILNKISSNIFFGHKPQVSLAKARKEIVPLKEKEKKISGEINTLLQQIAKLEKQYDEDPKIIALLSEKEDLKQAIEELKPSKNEKLIGEKKARLSQIEASIEKQLAPIKALSSKMQELLQELPKVQTEILQLQEKIDKNVANLKLGQVTRENFQAIGGTNVKLELPDATLDGTYISCDSFRDNLKKAGAQTYGLTFKSTTDGKTLKFSGLTFPKETSGGAIDKALKSLGAFGTSDKPGAGWQKLQLEDGRTLVVTDEEAEKLQEMGLMSLEGQLVEKEEWLKELSVKDWDISKPSTGGTVLLTSGNAGVYEMHKREMLSFLMRGMNVMAFNFRGYGESTGTPSGEGLKRDMEAAYQYLKTQHKVPDEKIMLKALCMSGGAAADLAGRHPNVNIFLDQTYANFDELALAQAKEHIDEFVKENELDNRAEKALKKWVKNNFPSIGHTVIKMATPAWSVANELRKVKGHVGILMTTRDTLMSIDRDAEKNVQAALAGQKAQSVSLFSMEGEHGDSWIYAADPGKVTAELIEVSTPEAVDEALKAIPKEQTDIGVNYQISWNSDDVDASIQELAEAYKESYDATEMLTFARARFDDYIAKINVKISEGEAITDSLLETLMEELLNGLEGVTPEFKESLKQLINKHTSSRIDILQLLKYETVNTDKILDELVKSYPETAKEGEFSRQQVKDFLLQHRTTFLQEVWKGRKIENLIQERVDAVTDEWKQIMNDFIMCTVTENNPLKILYNDLIAYINDGTSKTPKEVNDYLEGRINRLPKKFQEPFRTFIQKHIRIPKTFDDPDQFRAARYKGRQNMDGYLKRSGLIGNLA